MVKSCNFRRHRQSDTRDIHVRDDKYNNNNMTVAEDDSDVEMMDENIAAMVLTSLSCSPQSPQYPPDQDFKGNTDLS